MLMKKLEGRIMALKISSLLGEFARRSLDVNTASIQFICCLHPTYRKWDYLVASCFPVMASDGTRHVRSERICDGNCCTSMFWWLPPNLCQECEIDSEETFDAHRISVHSLEYSLHSPIGLEEQFITHQISFHSLSNVWTCKLGLDELSGAHGISTSSPRANHIRSSAVLEPLGYCHVHNNSSVIQEHQKLTRSFSIL